LFAGLHIRKISDFPKASLKFHVQVLSSDPIKCLTWQLKNRSLSLKIFRLYRDFRSIFAWPGLCFYWTASKKFFSVVHPTVLEQIFVFDLSIPTFEERSIGFGRGVQVLWPFSSCLERKEYRVPSSNQY
jgi:hypothetical protein